MVKLVCAVSRLWYPSETLLRVKSFHHLAYDPIILRQLNTLLSLGNNKVKCSIAGVVSRMVSFQS
jgi:hypothetical protein